MNSGVMISSKVFACKGMYSGRSTATRTTFQHLEMIT